ncbi:hypothetical protein ABTX80_31745 [Streptomyces erythrochromogenes]|uniref:hypothetical protein n=1 Tax=Streptomyces erythrochromogenes TaxID=285574 RepID=UPI0033229031
MYRFRHDIPPQEGPAAPPDASGANGLAQAAGAASSWIRRGLADRVEVLHRQRPVLAISRSDVRLLDEPRGPDTYQVRTLDRRRAVIHLGHAAHLRDALAVADEQLLSPSASAVVEIRRGHRLVGRLTSADRGRIWPGRAARHGHGTPAPG